MKKKSKTDWAHIDAMKNEDIDYSDIPPLDEKFFEIAISRAKDHTNKTISDKEMRKRLSTFTVKVKKSTQKAKASLNKGLKDAEDASG